MSSGSIFVSSSFALHAAGGRSTTSLRRGLNICPSTEELQADIKAVFQLYDSSKRGTLSRAQYKLAFLNLMGYKPSQYELQTLFGPKFHASASDASPPPPERFISHDDFLKHMTEKMSRIEADDYIRAIFKAFDTQSVGFLTLEATLLAFSQTLRFVPQHTVVEVFSEIDRDKDGRISYKDFERMMNGFARTVPGASLGASGRGGIG